MNVCLAVSGSVAAVKTTEIVSLLLDKGCAVDVVFSEAGARFMSVDYKGQKGEEATILKSSKVKIHRDEDEWSSYKKVGVDQVLHIELVKRNDILIIAPLSANTMSNIVHGQSSNLLTSVVRAWPYGLSSESRISPKPIIAAPSMNTTMFEQKITTDQLSILQERGILIIKPQIKTLACGDTGNGAMADPTFIVETVLKCSAASDGV